MLHKREWEFKNSYAKGKNQKEKVYRKIAYISINFVSQDELYRTYLDFLLLFLSLSFYGHSCLITCQKIRLRAIYLKGVFILEHHLPKKVTADIVNKVEEISYKKLGEMFFMINQVKMGNLYLLIEFLIWSISRKA